MESKCPYSNNLKFSGDPTSMNDETVNTTMDTEKGNIEMSNTKSKCPYNPKDPNNKEEISIKIDDHKTITNSTTESQSKTKSESKNENDLSDEEEAQGGCPMMGKVKKDPPNKHYTATYEIPRFGPFDFMFLMRGLLEPEDYLEKTTKIRSFPRHMKYTLFLQHQEQLQKVHEKEFPMVFFAYDDIKEKGNRLFRRKKFREAIEHYTYAYNLMKWIEFKDKKRQLEFIKRPSLDPILDEDIIEKHVYLDDVKVEEDSYNACVVYLLMNLASAYMELRHYSEAIDCFEEALVIAGDKVPDLFFRRSQARTYNKFSGKEELELAMKDIDKAISLKEEEIIYKEHKKILEDIIKAVVESEKEMTSKLMEKAKRSYNRIKERNLNQDEVIYTKKDKDAITQYKILKE